jgi:hypothetical protein
MCTVRKYYLLYLLSAGAAAAERLWYYAQHLRIGGTCSSRVFTYTCVKSRSRDGNNNDDKRIKVRINCTAVIASRDRGPPHVYNINQKREQVRCSYNRTSLLRMYRSGWAQSCFSHATGDHLTSIENRLLVLRSQFVDATRYAVVVRHLHTGGSRARQKKISYNAYLPYDGSLRPWIRSVRYLL